MLANAIGYNSRMTFRTLTIVYFAVLAVEIIALTTANTTLEMAAKPALMPILIYYFGKNTEPSSQRLTLSAALFFSWLGDVALFFDKVGGRMFVYGLAAFLIAHLFYIWFFLRVRKTAGVATRPNLIAVAAIAFYASALFTFVMPFVGEMIVPVSIYTIVISAMMISSVAALNRQTIDAGKWCVAGSALFLLSDSILAVNRFAIPFGSAPILVMLTYAVAQFLITEGARRACSARQN